MIATRLETGGPWFNQTQFHLNTRLEQAFQPIEIANTQFYLLPYFEPIAARLYLKMKRFERFRRRWKKLSRKCKNLFSPTKTSVS